MLPKSFTSDMLPPIPACWLACIISILLPCHIRTEMSHLLSSPPQHPLATNMPQHSLHLLLPAPLECVGPSQPGLEGGEEKLTG